MFVDRPTNIYHLRAVLAGIGHGMARHTIGVLTGSAGRRSGHQRVDQRGDLVGGVEGDVERALTETVDADGVARRRRRAPAWRPPSPTGGRRRRPPPRRRAGPRRPIPRSPRPCWSASPPSTTGRGARRPGSPSAPQCDATGSGSRSPIVATTIHGSESTTADHATARTRYHLGVLCRGPNRGRSPVMPPPPSSDEPCLHCSDGRIGVLPPWGPGRGRGSWAAPCGNGQTGNVAVVSAVRAARGVASDAPNRV